ncbi:glucan biosynthesis protein [Methylobacterium aerolatum]|uniref:Glucans biosynthesis protein n=1 Tax=Methylobacterium aerolatum TaxID=418708 RepID=A0ABU0I7I7_9HYPH|nr:glucan biosynthesis protein G [Methylobacterium aerolatum]MDQ0449651.1 glucans biosynthesis protein [Methylobacterium aerolatum]GJD36061.1 Glucans biosynthesis protein G [Methylobacterium aerolatum]
MHRRTVLLGGSGATLLGLLGSSLASPAEAAAPHDAVAPAPGPFEASSVRRLAQALSKQPYKAPSTDLPKALESVTYDQYRGIRFRKDRALWREQKLPFEVQFFPRAFLFRSAVEIFEVADGKATPVPYSPDLFTYDEPSLRVSEPIGFAGFRIHTPGANGGDSDELCAFLGASYFRAVAKGQHYGLSARGLAIGTGNPKGEEFARFRAFWLERPGPDSRTLVIHALLDSESVTGAYRFTVRPGDATVFDVESVLYPRRDIAEPGIATLTSMYQFGPKEARRFDDWRPAVHDSEALLMWTGGGEQLWRPLANPVDLQFSVFGQSNPKGFGLMQRARAYRDFEDLEAQYEKRPSLWIEPIGDWGQGGVDLVEIPTPNETNDNIVAFWRPKDKLSANGEYTFTYRMHWAWDTPWPTQLARITTTLIGAGPEEGSHLFVIDVAGEGVKGKGEDAKLRPEVSASKGKVTNLSAIPNPETGGWRISFHLIHGNEKLVELRAILLGEAGPVSETWLYRWTA